MITISSRAYRIMRTPGKGCSSVEMIASRNAAMTEPDREPRPPSTTMTRMSIDFRKPNCSGLIT